MPSRRLDIIYSIALLGLLFQGSGCMVEPVRAFEGEKLAKESVARIHCKQVYVSSVDKKSIRDYFPAIVRFNDQHGASEAKEIHLLPGRHRLTVNFNRQSGYMIASGINNFSLVYDFKANQDYAFNLVEANNGKVTLWQPELIDRATKKVLATAERAPGPVTRSKPGTATVRGQAADFRHTSTGRSVVLVLRNKATEDWIVAKRKYEAEPSGLFKFPPTAPPEREKPFQTTLGYGLGHFEFTDVPPGRYFVIFDSAYTSFLTADVDVSPTQTVVDNIIATPFGRATSKPEKVPPPIRADNKSKPV